MTLPVLMPFPPFLSLPFGKICFFNRCRSSGTAREPCWVNHCPGSPRSRQRPPRLAQAGCRLPSAEITRAPFVNISRLEKRLPDSALLSSPPPASRASELPRNMRQIPTSRHLPSSADVLLLFQSCHRAAHAGKHRSASALAFLVWKRQQPAGSRALRGVWTQVKVRLCLL